jgi:thiosulfate/3-mercaptopyruvate sulfurtransferase
VLEVGGNANAFGEGHLPGAAFVSMRSLSNPDDPIGGQIATAVQVSAALSNVGLGRDQTVVLYDRRNNLQAARAYWVLKYYQHADVRIYNGGTPKWTEDGQVMSTVMVEYEPSDYQAGPPDPEIRTTWQYVVDHTDDPATLFCDTRSPEEYLGRDVRAERGGRIPGSINVEWTAAVNANGTFKSSEELAALYGGAGFTPDKQIITYCQSGVRGAHTWFVLSELLGYPSVRNYDGSWVEYGNNPESPVEN